MIENIIKYQKEYLTLLEKFQKEDNYYDDYLLLIDKVELLLKRNKKTITNFLELNNSNYLYYGGATYFDNYTSEINPIIFSGKEIIIAEPLLKLSGFLKLNDFFDFNRIKQIIDNAIDNSIKLKSELNTAKIIYINPDDFINELKDDIYIISKETTIQYINQNLKTNYNNIDDFINKNKKLSFEEIEKKYQKLNDILFTVDSSPNMTLKDKILQSYVDCGISKEKNGVKTPAEQIILSFVGLFGQAFELKTISNLLKCPLYITRPNVILYLNCFSCFDENEKERLVESNIFFALYQVLKDKDTRKIKYNSNYVNIIKKVAESCNSIEEYVNELKKIVN